MSKTDLAATILAALLANPKVIERTPKDSVWKQDCVDLIDFSILLAEILVEQAAPQQPTAPREPNPAPISE